MHRKVWLSGLGVGLLGWAVPGCAIWNGFLDPTQVGQFPMEYKERGIRRVLTPRDTPAAYANATEPTPEDLLENNEEYRIGTGDTIAYIIEDLVVQGLREQSAQEVSPSGYVRIPLLGTVKVVGLTEQELEQELIAQVKAAQILQDPIVRVVIQNRRQQRFSIVGSVSQSGVYGLAPDLRLLDAIGLARNIGPEVKKLYVIRRVENGSAAPAAPQQPPATEGLIIPPPTDEPPTGGLYIGSATPVSYVSQDTQPATNPQQQFDEAIAPPRTPPSEPEPATPDAPQRRFEPLVFDPQTGAPQPAEPATEPAVAAPDVPGAAEPFDWEDVPQLELAQRVIEIDVPALLAGDPRYNIVIRNNDWIHVPVDTGIFYLMGEIARPGVYAFGGREITMKQAVASAGGFGPLAWPQRVEIIRREPGTDRQITIPVNVDAIFAGLEDDLLLRDSDIVNVGTHIVAPFLFVIRNSFRFTYGFGFVYDRNFADQDARGGRPNPETEEALRRQRRGLPF